jgi:hypothetical protein
MTVTIDACETWSDKECCDVCEDRRRSPGQWAPWIDDPDPPEPPMTDEQMTAFAKAVKELMAERAVESSSSPSDQAPLGRATKTPEQENEELLNDILRNHPNLTREEAQEQIDLFG